MERTTRRLIVVAVAGFAAVAAANPARDDRPTAPHAAAIGGPALVPPTGPAPRLPDPFPIRRVFAPADRFDPPAVGGFRKLSRDEFEERVRGAAAAQEAVRTPPALVRAEYRATYSPGRLSGRLAWTIANPGGPSGVATLDPLKVAIGPPTWADGTEAILFRGKLARRNLSGNHLWVGGAGGELTADWSARGTEEPDEDRFELGVPTAAISTLELTLPADRVPVCGTGGAILTGPFPADTSTERRWKLTFGGLSSVPLGVRRVERSDASPIPATRVVRYELMPGEVRGTFEFPGRAGGTESAFDVDPELRIVGVRGVPNDRWRYEAGVPAQNPGRLHVRAPSIDSKVVVTAIVPLPAGLLSFPFPSVRPADGSIGSDTLDVILHPDLTLAGWDAGDYRVAVTGQQSDRTFHLQFVGSLASTPTERRKPPVVRLRPTEATYTTDEALDWSVSPGRARLAARLKVKVLRGPLAVLAVGCESGYVLDAVTLTPGDTAVAFTAQPGAPGSWLIEPTRAIPTGQTVEFRLDFHSPIAVRAADPADPVPMATPLPFPRFTTAGAADRNGVLNVTGSGLRAVARTSTVVLPVGPTAFVVPYRGRLPDGDVRFTPERAVATLTGIEMATTDGIGTVTLTGSTDDTSFGSLTLFVPADTATVKAPGASVRRLLPVEWFPAFADPTGWALIGAAATSVAAPGTFWQITFERPQRGEFAVTVAYPIPVDASARRTLPVPTLGGVNPTAAKVTLSPDLGAVYRPPHADRLLSGLRTFPAKLELVPKVAADSPSQEWRFADLRVTSRVADGDHISVALTGRVTEATERTLTIQLPAGATVETASVREKWVVIRQSGTGLEMPLPEIPSGGAAFEVRYRLPKPDDWLLPRHHSPPPQMPTSPPIASHWVFADGYRPWPTLDPSTPPDEDAIRVVPVSHLLAAGLLLAGAVLAIGVSVVTRGSRFDVAILVCVLAVTGLTAWLTSGGWWVVVRPPLVAGFVLWAVAVTVRMRTRAIVPVAVAVMISPLAAQPDEPPTVFVVNADGGRFAVYAPQSVLDKLAEWSASPMPDVVVTRAEYTGAAGDGAATFDARFTLVSTRDGTNTLSLPLAGVRLERATVDGAEAFPDAAKPDRYLIPVTGKGRHELTLRFAVIPVATSAAREVRFTGPEVPVSRVTFAIGSTGVSPDVVSRRGGQLSRTDANGTTVTADHGGDRTVTVRWREVAVANAAGVVAFVREAGVWDVSETTPAVAAAFAFRIRNGLTDRLTFDLPTELRAVRVTARTTDAIGGVGVRGWSVGPAVNGWSPVEVRLTQPTDGPVTVVVRAVPTQPLTAAPLLRFPRAAGVPDADRDCVYGVRFVGVQATGMTLTGAIDYPPDALVKDFPTVPEFGLDRSPPARVVRRSPTSEAELRPTLVPVSGVTPAGSEVVFTLGRWVEAEGAFRATGKEVGHLEFDIPPGCDLRDVRANGLAGWSRTGSRVQVWLTQPATDLTVRWNGAVPRNGDAVTLPLPRWPGRVTPTEPLIVRVRPIAGWTVTPRQMTGMQPRSGGTASELVFAAEPNATATVGVTPVPVVLPRPVDPTSKPPAPPANEPPAAKPTDEAAPPSDAVSDSSERWYWARAAGWLVGLFATLALWAVGSSRWGPECLTGVGLLGASLFGLVNPIGWAFAAVAVAGLGGRVVRLIRGRVAG